MFYLHVGNPVTPVAAAKSLVQDLCLFTEDSQLRRWCIAWRGNIFGTGKYCICGRRFNRRHVSTCQLLEGIETGNVLRRISLRGPFYALPHTALLIPFLILNLTLYFILFLHIWILSFLIILSVLFYFLYFPLFLFLYY